MTLFTYVHENSISTKQMKLLGLKLICFITIVNAVAQSNLDTSIFKAYEHQTLEYILNDLEATYGINFSYGQLPLEKRISHVFQGKIEDAVKDFLRSNQLLFRKFRQNWVIKPDTPIGQPLKGLIVDHDTKQPLIGANIIVIGTSPTIGTSSEEDGSFTLKNLKVGRYDLFIEYLGYESHRVSQILVTTGKEQFIQVDMQESTVEMEAIVVLAKVDASEPLNEMATNSTRSFSVEETSRYAAALSDPARMALSFAGVTGNGDDLTNEIIIRGNSSKGLLWRMEGVEIPNPNHFGDLGSTGGSISMLSASMLTNSDFYTGAFPAEFGNALSGVFDLKLRNGNNSKREHSLQVGTLGIEAASEGYFSKKSSGSYLINYRYSTIDLIDNLLPSLTEQVNPFQDLTFKINLPTKKSGNFSLFGLAGKNGTVEKITRDEETYPVEWIRQEFKVNRSMGVMGLRHRIPINNNSYLHTSITHSRWKYDDETNRFVSDPNISPETIDITDMQQSETALYFLYNYKLNASSIFRTGINIRHKSFNYDYKSFADTTALLSFLNNGGSTQFVDAFTQWKYRFKTPWELNMGVNLSTLLLNHTWGFDPRMAVKYFIKPEQSISISTGLYTKPDHLSTYFIERRQLNGAIVRPNLNLKMLKAFHLVSSYELQFEDDHQIKLEAYYQSLFDIPVGTNTNTVFSVLNTSNLFDIIFLNDMDGTQLVSAGKGKNYGIELTLEKYFSKGYYYLFTTSFFNSKFKSIDQREFPTRYATNKVVNLLGGKEWNVGLRSKNAVGLNGKLAFVGGLRTTPILLQESILAGETVIDVDQYNSLHLPAYFRIDLGWYYRINAHKATHTFKLDIQNITDRRNISVEYYEPTLEEIVSFKQNGFIPFINYRIQFSFQ